MIVYRIETVERSGNSAVGYGAYRAGPNTCASDILLSGFNDRDLHPTPERDGMLCGVWNNFSRDVQSQQIFCFKSYNQLKNWFYVDDERVQLASKIDDIQIGVYYVPDEYYTAGHLQSIANKLYMKLIDAYPIGSDIPHIDPKLAP